MKETRTGACEIRGRNLTTKVGNSERSGGIKAPRASRSGHRSKGAALTDNSYESKRLYDASSVPGTILST